MYLGAFVAIHSGLSGLGKGYMTCQPSENHELNLAQDFVQYTGSHIFLTGKAGTGKTTFLHKLKENTAKRMIITAPTGVAAINAGGVTLHSFFQLPFGPFIPGSEAYEQNRQRLFRFSKEKKRIIKSLDLLVIDEISMVRADLLDSVDAVLRRHRRNDQPFGGVQLLMIGDLHQLSPVAKQDEWQLLKQYYESIYFFSSHALDQAEMVTIELQHIYRQSDARFIQLLNRVRDNRLEAASIGEFNRRYIENFTPEKNQGYITLTTHNNRADTINKSRLSALRGKEYCFDAEVSGDFPEHTYPTPFTLVLKVGAQVMFLRNDNSLEKRYYNGKIGKIKTITGRRICITCPGESEDVEVDAVEWENINYKVDAENREIQENIIGKFKQQLRTIFVQQSLPESDAYILERIGKASEWFQDKFSLIFDDLSQKFQMETDNKELGKKIGNALNNLNQEILAKLAGIKSCEKGFSPPHYLRSISKAEVAFSPEKGKKSQTPVYSESDIEHPELFRHLKDWRSRIAKEQGLAHFQILHQRVLIQIVINLPDNRMDLKKIKGVGKKTLENYGEDILALVAGYRQKHGIKINPN